MKHDKNSKKSPKYRGFHITPICCHCSLCCICILSIASLGNKGFVATKKQGTGYLATGGITVGDWAQLLPSGHKCEPDWNPTHAPGPVEARLMIGDVAQK